MQQDSIQLVTEEVLTEVNSFSDSLFVEERVEDTLAITRRIHSSLPDTLSANPAQMGPLPAGVKLAMWPEQFTEDYWSQGLLRVEKSTLLEEMEHVSGKTYETFSLEEDGIPGDPVPYSFKMDNFVTVVFLLSFFLVVWVVSRSRNFLEVSLKDFFRTRKRESLFAEHTARELRGQTFLIFQTCFVLGFLFLDYTQNYMTEVFNQVSPYKILGMATAVCLAYYLLKLLLFNIVNAIFFDRERNEQWIEAYLLCVLGLGLVLFPIVLLVVYFDLSFRMVVIVSLCVFFVIKGLLFYKCLSLFFRLPLGLIHLFLYFCALEITPLLLLWQALAFANRFLLTIN